MSRPRPWSAMTPEQRVALVRPHHAAGLAPSTIAWKIGGDAKPSAIAVVIRAIEAATLPPPSTEQEPLMRDPVTEPPFEQDGGAVAVVKGKARLADAAGVEPPPSDPISPDPRVQGADDGQRGKPSLEAERAKSDGTFPIVDRGRLERAVDNSNSRQAVTNSTRLDWLEIGAEERDRHLIAFCAEGLTAAQVVGRFVNASRNAVLGRVHRLQKKGHDIRLGGTRLGSAKGRPREAKPKAPRLPATRPERILRKPPQVESIDPPVVISRAAAFDPIPGVKPIALIDLGATTCRWPVDGIEGRDGLFCGAPCEVERSYCGAHRALAYVPPSYRLSAPAGA